MALSQAELDTKLATLQATADQLKAALAGQTAPAVDLTAEGAQVDAVNAELQALIPAATAPVP